MQLPCSQPSAVSRCSQPVVSSQGVLSHCFCLLPASCSQLFAVSGAVSSQGVLSASNRCAVSQQSAPYYYVIPPGLWRPGDQTTGASMTDRTLLIAAFIRANRNLDRGDLLRELIE